MSKRKLDSKYKDLVDYVNSTKKVDYLSDIISHLEYPNNIQDQMITDLNDGLAEGDNMDRLIQIIVDIYNDNYELDESKHTYRLNDIDAVDGAIYVTLVRGFYYFSTFYAPHNKPTQELTDEQFQTFLSRFPKFTADMFEALEV